MLISNLNRGNVHYICYATEENVFLFFIVRRSPLYLNRIESLHVAAKAIDTIASKINVTPQKCQIVRKNCSLLQHSVMKFDRSNKFDLCYYGQVNSLRLKSSVASKWASKHLWG